MINSAAERPLVMIENKGSFLDITAVSSADISGQSVNH